MHSLSRNNINAEAGVLSFYRTSNQISIPSGDDRLPIEITVVGKLPAGSGVTFIKSAGVQQSMHASFMDEFNETSALIGKTTFAKNDPTAIYTFGVDTRDL